MPSRALWAYSAVVLVGIAALVVVAAFERSSEAFTLGVLPSAPVSRLSPDRELCQDPIEVVEEFSRVKIQLATFGRLGPPYVLEVREASQRRPLTHRRVVGGYLDSTVQTVALPRTVPAGGRIAVCVRNAGHQPIAPYGSGSAANGPSRAYLEGRPIEGDVSLVFLRAEPASTLSLVPSIVERASLFHGAWATSAAYWVLLAALLVGPVLLIGAAVRKAFASQP